MHARTLLLVLSAALASCAGGKTSTPDAGASSSPDAASGADAAVSPDAGLAPDAGDPLCAAQWIDVHLHCDYQQPLCTGGVCTCPVGKWLEGRATGDGRAGLLLSLEHFAVDERSAAAAQMNEATLETSRREPSLLPAVALECWHAKQFADADWVAACKADVDRWIAAGAVAFKDHIGKAFSQRDLDQERWLGAFNRRNGFCSVPAVDDRNRRCLAEGGDTLRYPAMEAKWREVLAYIVETKQMPVITHAVDWGGGEATEQCYDPYLTRTTELCSTVNRSHLQALAQWGVQNLSAAARRRIVLAHFGFLELDQVKAFLQAGYSVDTSARFLALAPGGTPLQQVATTYSEQILLGTDYRPSWSAMTDGSYDAWLHLLSGAAGAKKTFTGISEFGSSTGEVTGLGLPAVARDNILRDNFLRLLKRTCPTR